MALTVLHDGAALDNFTKEGDYVVTNPAELLPGTYVVTIRKGMDSGGVGFTTQHCTAVTSGLNITRIVDAGGSGGGLTLGVNETATTTERLAVGSDSSFFSHDATTPGTGDHVMRINKNTITDTASVQFETGESARAQMGTFGTDSWSLLVSPDAAAWTTALIVDPTTGRVGCNVAPLADTRLRLGGALKVDGAVFLTGTTPAAWSTFWGGTETNGVNGLMFASNYGYLGSNGSFKMGLYWNGFRNTSVGWTSLNIGSSTVANALELGLNGFDFGTDTSVSGASPTVRMRLTTAGKLGVGTGALAPTCAIQADGPIRPKSYTVALALALSQATDGGAGALIYVSNESGGAVTAFSDGTTWRRVTDRAVIT